MKSISANTRRSIEKAAATIGATAIIFDSSSILEFCDGFEAYLKRISTGQWLHVQEDQNGQITAPLRIDIRKRSGLSMAGAYNIDILASMGTISHKSAAAAIRAASALN